MSVANPNKPVISEMPIVLEPAFPIFAPRPVKDNLNKQSAHLLFVNTSSFKLIFKITANVSNINYSIRPLVDYLPPRGCRFIAVSINETPQPKKVFFLGFSSKIFRTLAAECTAPAAYSKSMLLSLSTLLLLMLEKCLTSFLYFTWLISLSSSGTWISRAV